MTVIIKYPTPTCLYTLPFGTTFIFENKLYWYPYPTERTYEKMGYTEPGVRHETFEVFNMTQGIIEILKSDSIVKAVDVRVEVDE